MTEIIKLGRNLPLSLVYWVRREYININKYFTLYIKHCTKFVKKNDTNNFKSVNKGDFYDDHHV
jgi:hypothetical protein